MTGTKRLPFRKRGGTDMTEGNIFRHLIVFALPLLIGNIFQQFYNIVDTWVVGTFVGDAAFSAVGSVGPMINMLIGFFSGLSTGAGVVISQYYGAKNEEKVKETVHTAFTMTFLLSILFTVLGLSLIPFMLRLSNTPAEVIPESTAYLTIYFSGMAGLMFYNICSGILRAVGDSVRPFIFLIVSAVINTSLDLLFVVAFNMGVAGVAYATIIAQGVSAILVIVTLMRTKSCIRFSFRNLCFKLDILTKIFRVGLPAAIQMAITAFSNIFVQSYINQFGTDCMSGWTAYSKIDQLLLLPTQSLALASTTFVGQNLGKRQVERAKRGIVISFLMSVAAAVFLMIPVMVFAPSLVSIFSSTPEVIRLGSLFLRWITPFYALCCVNQIYAGALRGAGNSRAAMIIMLISFVGFRQLYLFIVSNYISNTIIPLAMAYPAGWMLASILVYSYYRSVNLEKHRLIEDTPSDQPKDSAAYEAPAESKSKF